MKPKFYLAAQFHRKDEIEAKKQELLALGFGVTSTWMKEEESPNSSLKDVNENYEAYAQRDLDEIDACDICVLFTVDPDELTRRGGRHFESGYAKGKGKHVIVVGPRENIFHHLPSVTIIETWEKFLAFIDGVIVAEGV